MNFFNFISKLITAEPTKKSVSPFTELKAKKQLPVVTNVDDVAAEVLEELSGGRDPKEAGE